MGSAWLYMCGKAAKVRMAKIQTELRDMDKHGQADNSDYDGQSASSTQQVRSRI